mmetsp:Transcript_18346/g.60248  ORF Transcript_18346/g.60248 Transcript_18346/m.60248 type:complete len:239 (-) Transcript_18346:892-1608(-)
MARSECLILILAGLVLSDWHIGVNCKKSNRAPSSVHVPTASRRINAVSSRNDVAEALPTEVSEFIRPIQSHGRNDQTDYRLAPLGVRSRERIPPESFLEEAPALNLTANESKQLDEECKSSPCTPEGGLAGGSTVPPTALLHDSDSTSNANITQDHLLNSVGIESIRRGRDMLRSPASVRSEAPSGFATGGPRSGLSPRSPLPPNWDEEISAESILLDDFTLDDSSFTTPTSKDASTS